MLPYIPLEDCLFTEVLARVAFRFIQIDMLQRPERYTHPTVAMMLLRNEDRPRGFGWLNCWILAYQVEYAYGRKLGTTRHHFITRAREGRSWRAVMLAAYKRGRADDPRVTNRGVTLPAPDEGGTTL